MLLTIIVRPLTCGCQQVAAIFWEMIGRAPSSCSLRSISHELLALFLIGFHRLPIDLPVEFGIAVPAVIAVRAAGIILVKLLVGVVDATASAIHRHTIVFARHLCVPIGGLYCIQFTIDIDLLELIDSDDRGVAVAVEVAGRYF